MRLLDKVKGILFDEEEIEIPEIKPEPKKEKKIKEESTIKEIKIPKDDFSDREYKSESTFTFPIDFEDEEPIKVLSKEEDKYKKVDTKPVQKIAQKDTRDFSDFLNKKNEKHKFRPTPIISPVYGVLDQNYKKEDVIVKKDILRRPNELSLDEVRKRAFGSLEEELEENLTNTKEIKIEKESTKEKIKEIEKPIDKMKTIGELIEEDNKNIEIPEIDSIEEDTKEYNKNDHEIINDIPKNTIDDLLSREETETKDEIDEDEADLFSLIDSMYEEKGE